MKQKLLFFMISLLLPIAASAEEVVINETNFPDEAFRNYLLNQDYGSDGVLTEDEIAGIKELKLYKMGIQDLKGIEFFTELTSLQCSSNSLTSLDVSKNTKLTNLACANNSLSSLNLSKNVKLTQLYCGENLLTSLDVSKNIELTKLSCEINSLTSLDVSKNTELTNLYCDKNSLTSLIVSKSSKFISIHCYLNQIKNGAMDAFIASLPEMPGGKLAVYYDGENEGNVCTTQHVASAIQKGWTVYYTQNGSTFGVYAGSEPENSVEINSTNFPDEAFRNYLLSQSYGSDGVLTEDEIAGIKSINVEDLGIQSLKGIEYFTALTYMKCNDNSLTSLDVSKNTELKSLSCCYNSLTSLDVSKNTELTSLSCYGNSLTSLDMSKNVKLYALTCFFNQIRGADMDDLITSLPEVSSGSFTVYYDSEREGNVCTTLQVAAAKQKGWKVYSWGDNYTHREYGGSEPENSVDNINFADALVKSICVTNWDTDGDGELSKDEAAAVTTIGDVFKGKAITSFDELQYFTGLAEISDWAFYSCSKLKSIKLPATITSIGENALTWCESLLSLNIPAAVTSIGGSAFAGLKSLQTLTVDAASQSFVVDDDVLYTKDMKTLVFCPPLLKSGTFTVKSTVKVLADNCFYLCDKLTAIILNEGLEVIGGGAFVGCSMQTLHIPASVLNVGYDYECQNLRSFTVDAANTHFMAIDGVLFMKNPMALIAYPKAKGNVYTIPDGTTDTQIWAFVNSPITEVTLPASMKMLRAATFGYCNDLQKITVMATTPPTCPDNAIVFYQSNAPQQATLYVPFGTKDLYEAANIWKDFQNIVEMEEDKEKINFADALVKSICVANWDTDGDGELSKDEAAAVTTVGYVFSNKAITSFDEFQYFTGVTTIENSQFSGCEQLKNITLPNSLQVIKGSFNGCTSLESIDIPANVSSIDGGAFKKCPNLVRITVDKGNYSFDSRDNCNAIIATYENILVRGCKTTVIPETVTEIGWEAFDESNITSIRIPASVSSISWDSFRTCEELKTIVVDGNNKTYDSRDNCNAIIETATNELIVGGSETVIPSTVTSIGYFAFNDRKQLKAITLPDGLKSIKTCAFQSCEGLTELTLPASLTSIEDYAFNSCTGLPSVTSLILAPFAISESAFYQCPALTTLYVPFGTKALYEATEGWSKNFKNIVEMEDETDVPVTIVANDYTREYGEENPDFDFTIAEGEIQSGAPEVSCAATKSSPVGTYDIIITKGTVSNKEVTLVRGTLTITKAPLTVKAGDYTIMEGEEIPQFVPTYEGFKLNETKVVLTVQPTVTCSATKYSGPGEYEVVVSGGEAQNYALSYVNGRLVIGVNPNLFSEGSIQYELLSNGSVAVIGDDSAEGDVVIPETVDHDGETYTVTEIAEDAFANNTAMTSVTIPETITTIGAGAFAGCTGLRDIFIYVPIPIDLSVAQARGLIQNAEGEKVPAFDGVDKESCVLHVPFGCGEAYRNAPIWGDFKNIVEMADPSGISAVDRSQLTSGKWYDLQGRMIKIEDGGLKPGIYIVNGRKVVIK